MLIDDASIRAAILAAAPLDRSLKALVDRNAPFYSWGFGEIEAAHVGHFIAIAVSLAGYLRAVAEGRTAPIRVDTTTHGTVWLLATPDCRPLWITTVAPAGTTVLSDIPTVRQWVKG